MDEELIEVLAAGMYGKNWNAEEQDKRPGEKMKEVWRNYMRDALRNAIAEGYKISKD